MSITSPPTIKSKLLRGMPQTIRTIFRGENKLRAWAYDSTNLLDVSSASEKTNECSEMFLATFVPTPTITMVGAVAVATTWPKFAMIFFFAPAPSFICYLRKLQNCAKK